MNINKKIIGTILEIIFLTFLIIFSNKMWNNLSINKSASTLFSNQRNFTPLVLNIKNNITELYPGKDITNDYIELEIQNKTDIDKEYVIYLIINNSEINTNYLKLKINNKEDYLNKYEKIKLKGKIYYVIDENISKNNTIFKEKCYIFLSDETPNSEQNKNIEFSFQIDEA